MDITPPLGTHLAGDGVGIHRPARTVLDPLFARALVVESNGRRICILAMDVLCVTLEYTRKYSVNPYLPPLGGGGIRFGAGHTGRT